MDEHPRRLLNISGGRTLELNRSTGVLYTFAGALAIHNHIYIRSAQNPNSLHYMFQILHAKDFAEYAPFMIANRFECHLEATDVCDVDKQALQACMDMEFADMMEKEI